MEIFGGECLRYITRTFVLGILRDNPALVIQDKTEPPLGGQRYHLHWRWVYIIRCHQRCTIWSAWVQSISTRYGMCLFVVYNKKNQIFKSAGVPEGSWTVALYARL